jgi:hypothetical protein
LNYRFTIYLGLAVLLSPTVGQTEPIRIAQAGDMLAPSEILRAVRSAGFRPIGRPGRDGANYVLRAIDRYGDDVQVIVDAEDADILYVRRLRSAVRTNFAGPRVHAPRYPDFFGDVPRPPRTVPAARATAPVTRAVAGPPIPRPRPGDVTGSVKVEPATPPTAPVRTDVPPVVGFE